MFSSEAGFSIWFATAIWIFKLRPLFRFLCEANNPASWQWVAGSGADAAPYFRVFNPVLQAEKFDPEQVYIKRWIPEIGTDAYPDKPIVDLKASREVALEAFARLKGERPPE